MHPEALRRLEEKLNEDSYSCERFCRELPYTAYNTCPLCLCGLLPVLVVCFSAICRLDYATHVTDIGAQIINKMGLSYTVYYTAGCWPAEQHDVQRLDHPQLQHLRGGMEACNEEDFEIAAGEFDAISGSLLRVRNVTQLHARSLTAVKVTPDWRFVTFIGSLGDDIGNLYAVNAQETDAKQAVPLLARPELEALDAQCQKHSRAVIQAQKAASESLDAGQELARLHAFQHLQVIIPGIAPLEFGGDFTSLPQPAEGSSLAYRAAFSFRCQQHSSAVGSAVHFSKIAVLDFILKGMNISDPEEPDRSFVWAESRLQLVDTWPKPPQGADVYAQKAAKSYHSHECPRFVPSKQGEELLFVAEDVAPARTSPSASAWAAPAALLPARLLAQVELPTLRRLRSGEEVLTDSQGESKLSEVEAASREEAEVEADRLQAQNQVDEKEAALIAQGAKVVAASSQMLEMGPGALPNAPISGCPDFVPGLYTNRKSLAETFHDDLFESPAQKAAERLNELKYRDNFMVLSDPTSSSVLGVDAQVLAGSLPEGAAAGQVRRVELLYNVKSTAGVGGRDRLMMAGCKPIRAAGRTGHMRMESALETVMDTLQIKDQKRQYTSWVACLTADQRIAIVESPDREKWINMSMPFPIWTGRKDQEIWCPSQNQDSCFEVWSNPNPNE
eukprot:TRINITY_DN106029_c0_g1_i1.p1 TRINITY_DN106029_c0_g1~~TRINITY_DN106029_c0_g1_i1.p1  ORF type:complete len:673 (+),score=140.56 TRINITY_DN106029_c0_g1_i1:69-2087(+)